MTTKSPKVSLSSGKSTTRTVPPPTPDEPLVIIQNPFRYFYHWLDEIKNWIKKDSDGEIRIHIPFKWFLTALVVFVAGGAIPAYWQGKAVEYAFWIAKPTPTPVVIIQPTLTPAPVLMTRLGVIKATYQVRELLPTPTPTPMVVSPSSYVEAFSNATQSGTENPVRFVLMTDTYKLIYLQTPSNVSLQKYLGYKALVTGMYTTATNTLNVARMEDIEVVY